MWRDGCVGTKNIPVMNEEGVAWNAEAGVHGRKRQVWSKKSTFAFQGRCVLEAVHKKKHLSLKLPCFWGAAIKGLFLHTFLLLCSLLALNNK